MHAIFTYVVAAFWGGSLYITPPHMDSLTAYARSGSWVSGCAPMRQGQAPEGTTEAQDGDSQDKRKRRRDRNDHRRDNGRAREANAAGAHAQARPQWTKEAV